MSQRRTVRYPATQRDARSSGFRGIDRRQSFGLSDPNSLWDAVNVELTVGGRIRRRGGLRIRATVDERTVGLYKAGGVLRCAYVSTPETGTNEASDWAAVPPYGVLYDPIGSSTEVPPTSDWYTKLTAYDVWDTDADRGPLPYLVLRNKVDQYEHHWVREWPAATTTPVDTQISVPFPAGPSLQKYQFKFYAPDWYNGNIHYSSVFKGPSVWDPSQAQDAGFFSAMKQAAGDHRPTAITFHQGNLAVFFQDAIQFWRVDVDEQRIQWLRTLDGPGTRYGDSIAPVIGDVFYYSEGGFRSLATATVTGEPREDMDLGAPIKELTDALGEFDVDDVVALWSQARQQYLCAFVNRDAGTSEVFVLTYVPSADYAGWTRWILPVVVDAILEYEGEVVFRSGTTIYEFDYNSTVDELVDGSKEVEAYWTTQMLDLGAPEDLKTVYQFTPKFTGTVDVDVHLDPWDREAVAGTFHSLPGGGNGLRLMVGETVAELAFTFRTTGLVDFESYTLGFKVMRGIG